MKNNVEKKYECGECGKVFSSYAALGGHKSAHSEKAKEANRNKSKNLTLERKTIIKFCEKCGKTFNVERKIKKNGEEKAFSKEKIFCSKTCSNSHLFSEETKNKISAKLIGRKTRKSPSGKTKKKERKYCLICEKQLSLSSKYQYCIKHIGECKERSQKISDNVKKQYSNGKEVYGGTTKWLDYKNFRVQGTYEYRTCFILDKMLENKEIFFWEKTKKRIPYNYNDENHYYLIDFRVIDNKNNEYFIETKGWTKEVDFCKWEAAEKLGIRLEKWFLKNIVFQEERLNITSPLLL